jgi:hypothetical protein
MAGKPYEILEYGVDTHLNSFSCAHCNENPIYVFPEKELHGLSPNIHIYVYLSDLYIPRIGLHIFLQQNRQIVKNFRYCVFAVRSDARGQRVFAVP